MQSRTGEFKRKLLAYITSIIISVLLLGPPLWMIMTAFKRGKDVFAIPPVILFLPTLENFINVVTRTNLLPIVYNTVLVTILTTILTQAFGTMAAYSISRFKTGGKFSMYSTLFLRVMPPVVLGLPMFILFNKLGIYDTILGLTLAYIAFLMPNTIWLMIAFFNEIPLAIEECARVDGASRMEVFMKITLPLAKSGIIVTGIYNIMGAWNHFFYALILSTDNAKVLSVQASEYVGEYVVRWGEVSAIATLLILPPIVLVFILQNYIEGGLKLGAIKG